MSESHHSRVLIIGSGPAGYTAAIYAARANLQPLLVAGLQPGGQMTSPRRRELSWLAEIIQGPWLMEQMRQQAEHVGTRVIIDLIVEIDLGHRPFVATGDSRDLYFGDTVIIATGAQARWLGLPSEEIFEALGFLLARPVTGFSFAAGCRGRRGRQHSRRGGDLFDEPCPAGDARSSPQCLAGGEDFARPPFSQPEDRDRLGQCR